MFADLLTPARLPHALRGGTQDHGTRDNSDKRGELDPRSRRDVRRRRLAAIDYFDDSDSGYEIVPGFLDHDDDPTYPPLTDCGLVYTLGVFSTALEGPPVPGLEIAILVEAAQRGDIKAIERLRSWAEERTEQRIPSLADFDLQGNHPFRRLPSIDTVEPQEALDQKNPYFGFSVR